MITKILAAFAACIAVGSAATYMAVGNGSCSGGGCPIRALLGCDGDSCCTEGAGCCNPPSSCCESDAATIKAPKTSCFPTGATSCDGDECCTKPAAK